MLIRRKPKNKEVYLGYYKDDGFVKRKGKGRIDVDGKWQAIKKKWLEGFINKKNEFGFSVTKKLTSDMEWVVEAYMETDYSVLSRDTFIKELKKYVSFKILNS